MQTDDAADYRSGRPARYKADDGAAEMIEKIADAIENSKARGIRISQRAIPREHVGIKISSKIQAA